MRFYVQVEAKAIVMCFFVNLTLSDPSRIVVIVSMPEEAHEPNTIDAPELEHIAHEPIMRASGSPISSRMIILVTMILIVIVTAAAVFAFSQGVFAHPASSY